MIINKSQASLLHNLRDEIETQMGIKLGYSSIWGSFVSDDDDFVIYEEGHVTDYPDAKITAIHLLHRKDFEQNHAGILVQENPSEVLLHDDGCRQFLKQLHFALEYGEITRNPKHTKQFENFSVKVIKMANDRFDVWIKYNGHSLGMMTTIEDLKEQRYLEGKEEILQTIAELESLILTGDF